MQLIYSQGPSDNRASAKLNKLIRAELQAVELYIRSLKTLDCGVDRALMVSILHCHQQRADMLAGEVRRMDAQPFQTSVVWQPFSEVDDGDPLLGELHVMSILEDGEEQTSRIYRSVLKDTDFVVQALTRDLYRKQEVTQASICDLKKQLVRRACG